MTPEQLAKSGTESGHQRAVFAYCAVAQVNGFNVADLWASGMGFEAAKTQYGNRSPIPELKWIHAIANGGSRGDSEKSRAIRGGTLKAEGVKSGVSDIFLPVKRGAYSGLYIEMKKPSQKPVKANAKGGVSDDQKAFGDFVLTQGFGFMVCYSWEEAVDVIKLHLQS